jgi:hypothetical protein
MEEALCSDEKNERRIVFLYKRHLEPSHFATDG